MDALQLPNARQIAAPGDPAKRQRQRAEHQIELPAVPALLDQILPFGEHLADEPNFLRVAAEPLVQGGVLRVRRRGVG